MDFMGLHFATDIRTTATPCVWGAFEALQN
jgi:hypothetical protein